MGMTLTYDPASPMTLERGKTFTVSGKNYSGSNYKGIEVWITSLNRLLAESVPPFYTGSLTPLVVPVPTNLSGQYIVSVYEVTYYDSQGTSGRAGGRAGGSSYQLDPSATLTITIPTPAPYVPASISVPTEIKGGTQIPISWGSSGVQASSYQLERQTNGGAWSQIYSGANRSYNDTVPMGAWNTVAYRVKASGSGGTSGYRTSNTVTVINNSAPVISGSDANLGTLTSSFPAQSYTVTDAEGGVVTVEERLDAMLLRSYNVTLGAANTLALSAAQWLEVTNGSHTATITATDSGELSAVRTFTFTKAVTVAEFEQTEVLAADAQPSMGIVNVTGLFPAGSILQVWICNNGNDASPTWQDISAYVLPEARKFPFTNSSKTAATWGVRLRVKLQRNTAPTGQVCALVSIGGNYK